MFVKGKINILHSKGNTSSMHTGECLFILWIRICFFGGRGIAFEGFCTRRTLFDVEVYTDAMINNKKLELRGNYCSMVKVE